MRVSIGSDHYGIDLKNKIIKYLEKNSYSYKYFGSKNSDEKVRLEDFIPQVCESVRGGESKCGVLICGTGAGVCIGANKFRGIRSVIARKMIDSEWARSKDDANVLCLSGWDTSDYELEQILDKWFNTKFDNDKIKPSLYAMDKWN